MDVDSEYVIGFSTSIIFSLIFGVQYVIKGQEIASFTVKTLKLMRNEEHFRLFWLKVTKSADKLNAFLPRRIKNLRDTKMEFVVNTQLPLKSIISRFIVKPWI